MPREVALYRYCHAFQILVIMPMGLTKTVLDPSTYHLILLSISATYTAATGALYRRAIKRWTEGSDG